MLGHQARNRFGKAGVRDSLFSFSKKERFSLPLLLLKPVIIDFQDFLSDENSVQEELSFPLTFLPKFCVILHQSYRLHTSNSQSRTSGDLQSCASVFVFGWFQRLWKQTRFTRSLSVIRAPWVISFWMRCIKLELQNSLMSGAFGSVPVQVANFLRVRLGPVHQGIKKAA